MEHHSGVRLPRIVITYCTQCRWMLRAAYFAQELLTTFSTAIGEIALSPATGGIFTVELTYAPPSESSGDESSSVVPQKVVIWDRKTEGGFPETKVLKQLVRNHIDPNRDLGHSDKKGHTAKPAASESTSTAAGTDAAEAKSSSSVTGDCKDCK